MKLTVWLKQTHPFSERVRIVERLASAVNEIHERGESLAALEPDTIDINDGECDITGARRGTPSSAYGAPERAEGAPPSPEADIYAAGAIAWEVLSGRPYASSPSHLAEAAPDVPRELADAVMACLEQSPQWRPRDLTYVAQLAEGIVGSRGEQRPARAAATSRPASSRSSARTPSSRPAALRVTPRQSRSHLVLAFVAAVVVVGAAASYYWLTRSGESTGPSTPTLTVAAAPVGASPALSPTPAPAQPPPSLAQAPSASPAVAATPPSAAVALATPVPTPPPAMVPPRATATPPPITAPSRPPVPAGRTQGPTEVRRPVPPAAPPSTTVAPVPTTTTTTTTLAAAPVRREPAFLSAISPLSIQRGGKHVFDLRGTDLGSDLRARIVPLKEAPRGITIVRQVCKGPTLFQVLVDVDASVKPGDYAITLEHSGGRTNPLTFTVTK